MKGKIINFRRALSRTYDKQMIVQVEGVDNKEKATELLKKEVVWKSTSGKEIKGYVSTPHGNKGLLRIVFESGMPGQAINTEVTIN